MSGKKKSIAQLLYNNRFVTAFSIVLAVLLYIVVAMTSKDTINHTIYNVPVNLDLQAANLANLQLYVIEGEGYSVDVTINGSRTQVPQYGPDDSELATTARISNITEPGTYTLPVTTALSSTDTLPFSIVRYSPSTIQVRLDRIRTASFDIQSVVRGLSVAPGYVLGAESVNPRRVTVNGPESEVNRIASAEVSLDLTEPLALTYGPSLDIVLRDAQGQELDPDEMHLTLDVTEATLVIPVLQEARLPVTVSFLNVPRGFPEEALREYMSLSADSVLLAGPIDVVGRLTELRLDPIDLKNVYPGSNTFVLPLRLDEISDQVQSMENVSSITVTFDDSRWYNAFFNIQDIEIVNIPLDYDARLLSTRLDSVEFIGERSVLESMTADDIVAQVDLADYDLTPGQRNIPVKISVPGKGLVWSTGTQSTVIQISKRE